MGLGIAEDIAETVARRNELCSHNCHPGAAQSHPHTGDEAGGTAGEHHIDHNVPAAGPHAAQGAEAVAPDSQ